MAADGCYGVTAGSSRGDQLQTISFCFSGASTAEVLRGVHVVMAVRNVSAGLEAREAIMAKIPARKD